MACNGNHDIEETKDYQDCQEDPITHIKRREVVVHRKCKNCAWTGFNIYKELC